MNQPPFDYLHRTITLTDKDGAPLALQLGLTTRLYTQEIKASLNEVGQRAKRPEEQRLLLTSLSGSNAEKAIVNLDIEIAQDGRLAHLPHSIELESNANALEPIGNADIDGLTLYGAVLDRDEAKSKSVPWLLESGEEQLHVYFQGENDKFLCAQLDPKLKAAEYSVVIEQGVLKFTAKEAGSAMNHAEIGIEGGTAGTANVQFSKDMRPGKGAPNAMVLKELVGDALEDVQGANAIAFDEQWLVCSQVNQNRVLIFERLAGIWQFQQILEPPRGEGLAFGKSVVLNGSTLIIGDPSKDKVYLYDINELWKPPTVLTPENSERPEAFGSALSSDKNFLAVGAPKGQCLWTPIPDEEVFRLSNVDKVESPTDLEENQNGDLVTALEFKGQEDSYAFWPLETDGVDDPGLIFDQELTVEFWARCQDEKQRSAVFFAKDNSGTVVVRIYFPYDGKVYFDAGTPYDRITQNVDNDFFENNWTHWAFVKNVARGEMTIYKNSQQWLTAAGKTKALGTIDRLFLGLSEDNTDYSWSGALDCIRIWNRALTEAEIAESQNLVTPQNKDGLILSSPKLSSQSAPVSPPVVAITNSEDSKTEESQEQLELFDVETVDSPAVLEENTDGSLQTALEFKGQKGSYAFWPLEATEGLAFSQELTLEFWARFGGSSGSVSTTAIIAKNSDNEIVLRIHFPYQSDIYFDAGDPYERIQKRTDEDFYDGNWIHWAFVKNVAKGEMAIYKNGQQWHLVTGVHDNPLGTIDRFFLGSSEDNKYYWQGALDCIRIWNKALSQEEIAANYLRAYPDDDEGLLFSNPQKDDSQLQGGSGCVYVYDLKEHNLLQVLGGGEHKNFGSNIALQGDHLLVGAPGDETTSGAAYAYRRNTNLLGEPWEISLTPLPWPSGETQEAGLNFGAAVAKRGLIALVGCPGLKKAFVYSKDSEQGWVYRASLQPDGKETIEGFGERVALGGNGSSSGSAARADIALVTSAQADAAFVYYKNGTEAAAPFQQFGFRGGKAAAIVGDAITLASSQELFYYSLSRATERWLHVPRQVDYFVAIINGEASSDPNDFLVRKVGKLLYDYHNRYFIYSLAIVQVEGTPATGHLRFTTRSIKGGISDLDSDHQSVVGAMVGAKITATLETNTVTLTIELPKVYQSVKIGGRERTIITKAIKETWSKLPTEPETIAAILNGKDDQYNYGDAQSTDNTVVDLSAGSELITATIDRLTDSDQGQLVYDVLAVETAQGKIPPNNSTPYASHLFELSTEGLKDKTLVVPEVPKKDTFSVEYKEEGHDATWHEDNPNYELNLSADQCINVPVDEELHIEGDLCMEAWIRPDSDSLDSIAGNLFEYHQPDVTSYKMGLEFGRLTAYHSIGQTVKKAKTLATLPEPDKNDGSSPWSHVAAVYNSSYVVNFDSALEEPLYLDCGTSEHFDLDKGLTLETWVKTPKDAQKIAGTLVSKWGDDGENWKLSIDGSQKAVFSFNTEGGLIELQSQKQLNQPDTLYYLSAFMDCDEHEVTPLHFNGTTEIEASFTKQVRLSSVNLPTSIDAWPSDYTIEFWVYMDEAKDAPFLEFEDASGTKLSIAVKKLSAPNPKLFLETDKIVQTDLCLEEKKWNHLAITKGAIYQYIEEGEERSIQKFVLSEPLDLQFTGAVNLSIGSDSDKSDYLNGEIAELRLWNIDRDPEDIHKSRYNSNLVDDAIIYRLISNRDYTLIADENLGPQTKEKIGPFAIGNSFAFDFWAKRSSNPFRDEWVLAQKDEDNYDLYLGFKNKQVAFGWDQDPAAIPTFPSYESDDQWHHYLIRCIENTETTPSKYDVILYVDGKQQDTLQFDTIHKSGGALFIGRGITSGILPTNYFKGHLYNIRFWNSALELGEIYSHRFATLDWKTSGLEFSLPLQDGGRVAKNLAGRGGSFLIKQERGEPSYDDSFKLGLFDAQLTVLDLNSQEDDRLDIVTSDDFREAARDEGTRPDCTLTTSSSPINIGRLSYSVNDQLPLLGLVAEVRIWEQGLEYEPLEHYRDKRLKGDEAYLIANWQLNEGRGHIAQDVVHGNNACLKAPADVIPQVWLPFPDARYAEWHFFLNGQCVTKDLKETREYDPPAQEHSFSLAKGFSGSIGEFRLWKTDRTPAQIADNRYRALDGQSYGLVGYWPCNEAKGTIVKDHSRQGNDGSLSSTAIERIGEGSSKTAAPVGSELPFVRNVIGGEAKAEHEATALLNTPMVAEYQEQQVNGEGKLIHVQKRCYIYPLEKRCGGGKDKLAVIDNFKVNDATK